VASPPVAARPVGPFETPFSAARKVFFAAPTTPGKHRLIANLHGLCNPPGYACGYWTHAASEQGFLVCPEGNTRCGPGGPPSWDEPASQIDRDLEQSVEAVSAQYQGEISREDAVLTGFSRGAWVAPAIATMHPGRWRYLVLNEADVPLSGAALRKAGVTAVVMIAGELGSQLRGERATIARLSREGFAAKLIVMPKAGHYYSANIDDLMAEALAFLVGSPE
jgi:predicted esterase